MSDMIDVLTDDEGFDLDEFIDEQQRDPGAKPKWEGITGRGSAQWAMAKYAKAAHVEAREDAIAQEMIERVAAARDANTRRARATKAFMGEHLKRYARSLRVEDPDAKTLTLPSGVLKTREAPPKLVVEDEAALIAWLRENFDPDVLADVLNPPKVSLSALKRHVVPAEGPEGWMPMADGGEIPAGIAVEVPDISVTIVPENPAEMF